jgi:AraC family transcriptional activator of pobA
LLSISPNYLSQIIKKRTNKKALSFINEKMINEAKSSILHSNHNIGEIAKRLNFSDTSNFVKFFKSKTGKTPMEYKKQKTEEPVYHTV